MNNLFGLQGKNAIVYGAGGSVGSAVAKAYHAAGARVYLAGRGEASLEKVVKGSLSGRDLSVSIVDTTNSDAVKLHMQKVVDEVGSIDFVFTAVTYDDVQGQSLDKLDFEVFSDRMAKTVAAQYHVTQAAAFHMIARGSGLISTIIGHGQPWPEMGTTMVSWGLVEAMLRQWAADLGPKGVRVAWLRTGGFHESVTENRDYGSSYTGDAELDDVIKGLRDATMLKVIPSVEEAGRAAVYLAAAQYTTAGAINLTAGAYSD